MVGATHPLQHETITPRSATTTHTPPIDQPTTAQQCSSTYGSTPVCEEHLIASRVLRSRSPARNAGRFVILRPPAMSGIASEPPLTKHPPPTHRPTHHSSTTAVQQYVPTNPQQAAQQCSRTHHSSTPAGTRRAGWGGDFHFLTILRLPGESASRPRERLFTPPARRVGDRRP